MPNEPTVPPPIDVLGPRDLVVVSGADASSFLQSQISQDLEQLDADGGADADGAAMWTFVLEPSGKVHSLARLVRQPDGTLMFDIEAGFGQALADRLARFMIRVDVELSVIAAEPAASGNADVDLDALVEAKWPRLGVEITPGETVPAGLGINDVAVSFTKGCYPGQELVERMESRGTTAPEVLTRVALPAAGRPGDPVVDDDGIEIGRVTTVAGGRGLAWIKRDALDRAPT